jgi:hypothetical protein
MKEQSVENQTRMYMYDLMNTAKEFGFKGEDSWQLSMVTDAERQKIQKDYYPTIAAKIIPEFLLQVFNLTKQRLNQSFTKTNEEAANRNVAVSELNYIVAFNPKRPRA